MIEGACRIVSKVAGGEVSGELTTWSAATAGVETKTGSNTGIREPVWSWRSS